MEIETIPVGPLQVNCYIISDPDSLEAIIIDPGSEADRLIAHIEKQKLNLKSIINTHCHIDHAAEAKTIQEHFNIPFLIHENELPLLDTLKASGGMFGITVAGTPSTSDFLQQDQTIFIGKYEGKILFTPGHSPGGISFYITNHIFVGDCLFRDSIGRTDLPGGNFEQLISSIKNELFTMDDTTIVHPGHGLETTIGYEKQYNPFLNENEYL